ncbi:MAG: type II toxin-antitoxin system CcdA family antitoxin [Chitinivorax sp.]|jgi:antitoxin CcdA
MKNLNTASSRKRPVNLLLNEANVQQARALTDNLSATVDALLSEFVANRQAARQAKQQQADAIADAWNRFNLAQDGSFADDHSTL